MTKRAGSINPGIKGRFMGHTIVGVITNAAGPELGSNDVPAVPCCTSPGVLTEDTTRMRLLL